MKLYRIFLFGIVGLLIITGLYVIVVKNRNQEVDTIKATFLCENTKSINAEFFSDSASLTLSDNRTILLSRAVSASGARYANTDETFVFWNKGNTAFIEEHDQITFENCVEKEK